MTAVKVLIRELGEHRVENGGRYSQLQYLHVVQINEYVSSITASRIYKCFSDILLENMELQKYQQMSSGIEYTIRNTKIILK